MAALMACGGGGLSEQDITAIVATEVVKALTKAPSATPDLEATTDVANRSGKTARPAVAATPKTVRAATTRLTEVPKPADTLAVGRNEVIKSVPGAAVAPSSTAVPRTAPAPTPPPAATTAPRTAPAPTAAPLATTAPRAVPAPTTAPLATAVPRAVPMATMAPAATAAPRAVPAATVAPAATPYSGRVIRPTPSAPAPPSIALKLLAYQVIDAEYSLKLDRMSWSRPIPTGCIYTTRRQIVMI